ncbi:MAG: redoxin domain-containing protein [Chloroflexi bacterium OLB15]|nr:MAG: redoxin domain-containing protein [Chloroflexi bacterium OLB15]
MTRQGFLVGQTEMLVRNEMLVPGEVAPNFRLTANNWAVKSLDDYAGRVKIISVVPSLDTRVCAAQTRHFNEDAAALGENVVILTVSADLPYAQRRWCAAEGIDRVETLSDHKDMSFSDAYGVHVVPMRITQRSVFVIGADNRVCHAEYIYVIGNEVNFQAALEAARAAL